MKINKALQSAHKYYQAGNLKQARDICKKILRLKPNNIDALHMLEIICCQLRDFDDAIRYIRKELELTPSNAEVYYKLGTVLQAKGLFSEAIDYFRKAITLKPRFPDAYYNLGLAFQKTGQIDEAILNYQKAIQLNPDIALTYINLAGALREKGQLEEAITCCQKALHLKPDYAGAYNNLAILFEDKGQLNDAEIYFRRVLQIAPDKCSTYSNLLLNMNYNSRHNSQDIFAEHLLFAKKYAERLSSAISPHTNEREPNRKLRIGYFSPDFRRHSVAYFIEPVLAAHNREHFEVFCYSNSPVMDEVTKRIQEYSDQWRGIVGMSDEEVAELIRKEEIDILVDLAGHTANNRILLFACKPAPIQVSWIGYLATTGLSTTDYKIVDGYTDPSGKTEQFHTEELIRLPECSLCYLPDRDSPEVGPLPALSTGHITFGSFNNFRKMTPEVIGTWIKILKALPGSHLVLKTKSLSDGVTYRYALDMFTGEGIEGHRIKLLSWMPSTVEHLNLYNQVDIALDTFPYNGVTTTCEALWMGVPVITLGGDTYASRVGVSLLSNVGLPDLVAKTSEEYISLAINLANDLERLKSLRENLRDMMKSSALCDAKKFTENLEMCYRKIWQKWCEPV